MDHIITIKAKGQPWDGYEGKIIAELKEIRNPFEKKKRDYELSGRAGSPPGLLLCGEDSDAATV
jgi:hypothetical protein